MIQSGIPCYTQPDVCSMLLKILAYWRNCNLRDHGICEKQCCTVNCASPFVPLQQSLRISFSGHPIIDALTCAHVCRTAEGVLSLMLRNFLSFGFPEHALHNKPAQHGLQKVTAQMTSIL